MIVETSNENDGANHRGVPAAVTADGRKSGRTRGTLRRQENYARAPHTNQTERRALEIFEGKIRGKSYRELQAEFGVSPATVRRAIKWARETMPALTDVEATGEAIAALDLVIREHWEAIARIKPGYKETLARKEETVGDNSSTKTVAQTTKKMNEAVLLGHLKGLREAIQTKAELCGLLQEKVKIQLTQNIVNVAGDLNVEGLTEKDEAELEELVRSLGAEMERAGALN